MIPDISKLIGTAGLGIGPMPNFAHYELGAFSLKYFQTSRLRLFYNEPSCQARVQQYYRFETTVGEGGFCWKVKEQDERQD